MIGIISAMDIEMERLLHSLKEKESITIGSCVYHSGLLFNKGVVLCVCGPGKVNAALCAQAMILHFKPQKMINLGVAGGLKAGMKIGDLVIGTSCVQHDFDITALGEPLGLLPVLNQIHIPSNENLVAAIVKAAQTISEVSHYTGVVATGDQFVASTEKKAFIVDHFNALCCEMEGGAIAHACALHNLPFVVIRAISDGANDGATMDYPAFKEKAAITSARLMEAFLKQSYFI